MSHRPIATMVLTVLAALALLMPPSLAWAQTSGLVAAFAFNEGSGATVIDSSGNNNTGTISGATWTTAGKFGKALVFNGTSARVTIPDSPSLRLTTGMTLEAWVNPSTVTSAWRDVIYKGDDNYFLEVTSDHNKVPGGGGTVGGADAVTYGTAALAVNKWTHLALTYDGAILRLYVNGVQASSLARTGNILTSTNPLQIGGDSIYGQYFKGTIDEVRVYNRALIQAEIQTDMNTAIGSTPPPDTTPPTVAITTPTSGPTYTTNTSPLTLGGTAADNVGVTQVSWASDRGGSGTASGTTSWSVAGIALQAGTNVLTITARDAAGNTGTATLTVTYTAPTGLIAAYAFNEGSGTAVTDSSGNNNTGTISGATWTTVGKFGSALVFNGTSAVVTIADTPALRLTTAMTLEAWVNPSTVTSAWRDVIYKGDDRYFLEATSDHNKVPGGGGTVGVADVVTYGTAAVPVNTWTHLALTYDGATLRLYVNGVQVSSLAQTGNIARSTNPLQVGGDSIYGQYFQGTIDEVRVYNRALSQAEIQTDMNTPVSGTPPPPDTTPPTVALTSPPAGSTVFSLVSVSATASDNVDVAGVQFLLDGAPLGAEATFAPYAVVWDTTSALGSHSLVAVARDIAGNTATSAPVAVTVVAATTSLVGQWSAPVTWPIVAVHANLLSTGEILAWDGQTNGYDARLWNPTTGVFTKVTNNQTNMFCSGHCALADGRTLVAGGHGGGHTGVTDTNLFDPVAHTWTLVAPMAYPRWYPTTTTLPDGRVLATAGEINCDRCDAPIPEIYNPQTNVWTQLSNASLVLPYYPHMFVLPDLVGDGHVRVLAAATAEDIITTYVLDVSTQTWSTVDPDPVDGGSSAMYLPGKVMKSGTSTDPDMPVFPSEATTYVLDMTQPAWRETAPMVFPRTYHTLTLLADGTVLATGGGVTTDAVGVSGAVSHAELWSPVTETWTTMASMQKPRLYHSTALLLPDGRVLAAGGGRFNGVNEPTDQLSSETYSPPYLFKGTRPTISSAPATATYGGTLVVQTPDAARITAVSLLRLGAVTHAFNQNQRFLQLPFVTVSGAVNVQAPANANLAPPGYYMLFILDTNGVPSVAATLKLQ
jgi:hypothetical protein